MNKNFYGEIISRLESQIGSNSLTLADTYLGDEGAVYVANFLKNNTRYSSLDLRGNNISAEGFKIIAETFRYMSNLKTLGLEWNCLGSNISGIVNIRESLKSYNTISSIDLKNNQIGSNCAYSICDMIKELSNLKTLDLRWNTIGNEGAKLILATLKETNRKIKINLDGNSVSEGLIQEISSFETNSIMNTKESVGGFDLDSIYNRKDPHINSFDSFLYSVRKNEDKPGLDKSISSPFISVKREYNQINQEPKYPNYQFTPQTKRNENLAYDAPIVRSSIQKPFGLNENIEKFDLQNENIRKLEKKIYDLEAQLSQERLKVEQAQDKYQILFHEHEIEKKYRQETESKQLSLKDDMNKKVFSLQESEYEREKYKKENSLLREEMHKLKATVEQQSTQYSIKLKESEDRFNQALKELINENAILKSNNDKVLSSSDERINEVKREYEIKFRQYDEQLKSFYTVNTELSEELKKQTEYIQKLKLEFEDNVRKIVQKTREEEYQKNIQTLRTLESRMNGLNETNELLSRKNNEMVREIQLNERRWKETIYNLEGEVMKFKTEAERNFEQLLQANSSLEKSKVDLVSKDSALNKYEKEYYNFEKEIQKLKSNQNDESDKLRRELEIQKKKHDDFERQSYLKIGELERTLKESQIETNKYKTEYEKLCGVLQGNLNKAISKTINEHARPSTKYEYGL